MEVEVVWLGKVKVVIVVVVLGVVGELSKGVVGLEVV